MFLPHRRHRRLLLPPGWVALGFLLLLGCQILLTHRRRLLPKNVLQLYMPTLKSNVDKVTFSLGDATREVDLSYEGRQVWAAAEVDGHWHDVTLMGSPVDSLNLLGALAAIRTMKADTGHAGGVRIYLCSGVAYRNLICLLDSVNNLQLNAYWLDIRRSPAVFYAIVRKPITLAERRYYKENECQGMI